MTETSLQIRLIQPEANYGNGIKGTEVRRELLDDPTLRTTTFDLARAENAELMFRHDIPEGRKQIARTLLVEASIQVTSTLVMSDELSALPVADDITYPKLLSLRTSSSTYVGGSHSLAPLLGLQFARSVIPAEVLAKLNFKDIFEYRTKVTKESFMTHGRWKINRFAAKIAETERCPIRPKQLKKY